MFAKFRINKAYLLLTGDRNGSSFQEFQELFTGLFPYFDISSDIYLLSENTPEDFSRLKETIGQVALFLGKYPFYRINIHPVHPLPPFDFGKDIYHDLFQITSLFNREGYLHQSVSRMMILPIFTMEEKDRDKHSNEYFDFLRDRLIIPSIYISEVPPSGIGSIVKSNRERVYLELTEGKKQERIANTLGIHSVFDELTIWANNPGKGGPLPGCRSVILREKDGNIYNCFRTFSMNKPLLSLYTDHSLSLLEALKTAESKYSDCLNCSVESLALMKDTLKINKREKEAGVISFRLGMAMVKREDYDGAIRQFDQALENQSESDSEDIGTILTSEALCHLRQNEVKKAITVLNEAERYLPSSAMIYYYRGLCEFGLKDYIEAIDRFNSALKLGTDQLPLGDVYFYLGLSHINIEEYEDGLAMMNHAEEFFTNKSPVYYYMGICHLGMLNPKVAMDYLKNALACQPDREDLSSIYLHLGLCYKEMERYEDAISELKEARDLEDGRKDVHNLMGYCYFKLKEYDQAIDCFLKAVEIDPNSAIDYANIAVNLKEKGETQWAVSMFKKALSIDPTIGFVRRHLNEINQAPQDQ